MWYINCHFRSARRALRVVNRRGDGSVESERMVTYTNRDAAERHAERLRREFPDTTYTVEAEPIG